MRVPVICKHKNITRDASHVITYSMPAFGRGMHTVQSYPSLNPYNEEKR